MNESADPSRSLSVFVLGCVLFLAALCAALVVYSFRAVSRTPVEAAAPAEESVPVYTPPALEPPSRLGIQQTIPEDEYVEEEDAI